MVNLPAKGPDDLSACDVVAAFRVGLVGRGKIRSAMAGLRESWLRDGVATFRGETYAGRLARHRAGVCFYLDRCDLPRFGARLVMRVGGFEQPGEYLVKRMVADLINATTQADWFAGPWAGLAETARSGGAEHWVGNVRLRVGMVTGGTKTAVGLHRDDVAAFARVAGITLGEYDAWEEGWLNERDVAAILGTYADHPAFSAAWDGMKQSVAREGGVDIGGVSLRAAWLRRIGAVTVYLHRTSVEDFDRATGVRRATSVPPPRSEGWVPSMEFARMMGISTLNHAYRVLLTACIDDVQAGRVPSVDGHPVRFRRMSNNVARPWCFHRSALGTVMRALGVSDHPRKGPDDMSRLELYAELGTTTAGTQAIVAVWEACKAAWARGEVADMSGHRIRGGLRRCGVAEPYCCINASDVSAFRMAMASMGEKGLRDSGIVRRGDGYVPLREMQGIDAGDGYLAILADEMEATFDPVSRTATVGGRAVPCGFVSARHVAVRGDGAEAVRERLASMRAEPAMSVDEEGCVSEEDLVSMFGP